MFNAGPESRVKNPCNTCWKVLLWGIPLNLFSNLYIFHSNIFLRWPHA
ncbi:hypothetical protein AMTRI_Chr06g173180 [Amborella trichopoda]